ncbi:MAG: NUDIX domain-containing protein [Bacteroidetes bacterium]|nr:NUDIX domain-containing protein [Bacteroidota bacterium]
MNRKIYFNDKFIELIESDVQPSNNQAINFFDVSNAKKQAVKKIISDFLKSENNTSITLNIENFNDFLSVLKKQFYYIEAAGGFIEKENKYLFIHRHGRWDLPKGKLEENESAEAGAIRECEEECGVKKLKIVKQLPSTFHIYAYKDGFALKQAYWFYMQTDYEGKLIPQTEEDIHDVKFFSKKDIQGIVLKDTYYTISDVVTSAVSNFL